MGWLGFSPYRQVESLGDAADTTAIQQRYGIPNPDKFKLRLQQLSRLVGYPSLATQQLSHRALCMYVCTYNTTYVPCNPTFSCQRNNIPLVVNVNYQTNAFPASGHIILTSHPDRCLHVQKGYEFIDVYVICYDQLPFSLSLQLEQLRETLSTLLPIPNTRDILQPFPLSTRRLPPRQLTQLEVYCVHYIRVCMLDNTVSRLLSE